jgi:predicted permease
VSAPRWTRALLARLAEPGQRDEVLGDLDEAHGRRIARWGRIVAAVLTSVEALDMALALRWQRGRLLQRFRGNVPPDLRAARRRRMLPVSWLDFKLGLRMLVRYPGLTLVGGLSMAFGIAAGAGGYGIRTQMIDPVLPLDEGDRIVGIRMWNTERQGFELRVLYDFLEWRGELGSIEELSAFRNVGGNLITERGVEVVQVAEVTASAFRVARVPPLMGRPLVEADEAPGAPPVLVIGHDLWQSHFGGDPQVVGRPVGLGGTQATVVGVMPEGFAFPSAHELWTPLRLEPLVYERGEGPSLVVFGRLAPGAGPEDAGTELATIGQRMAAAYPDTHQYLQPRVVSYANALFPIDDYWQGLLLANVFLALLMLLVCANVALLLFARATSRESEIAVRGALGASRLRIIGQLVVEALLLAGVALAVGLPVARYAIGTFWTMYAADSGAPLPFWFGRALAPTTVLYAIVLTSLGALFAGVVPALKVTGRGGERRLRETSAGGGRTRFGGAWTVVIIAQVAATVVFPAAAFIFHRWVVQGQALSVGFPAGEYVSGRLELQASADELAGNDASADLRRAETYEELTRRLATEPAVGGVALTDRLPATRHPTWRVEIDGDREPPLRDPTRQVSVASIGPTYLDVLGASVLAGRPLAASDFGTDPRVVLVNESFVDRVLEGRNPVGLRIRSAVPSYMEPRPWSEIVGVVADLGMYGGGVDNGIAGLYRPLDLATAPTVHLIARVGGEPESFTQRLRTLASEVDPALAVHELMRQDQVGAGLWLESQYLSRLLVILSSIALLLSLAAIYSVVAFTVARRTREIGVRVALGAGSVGIVTAILRRPLVHVALGVAAGSLLVPPMTRGILGGTLTPGEAALTAAYALVMTAVCMLACVVPTRRALRVEPTDALRAE